MERRIAISEVEPDAYKAMMGIEKYLASSSIEAGLAEMIRLRASQINGCAYCIEIHSAGALKHGQDQNKVFAVSAWWESPLFTEKERTAFALTDEVTLIADGGLNDEVFVETKKYFTENEIAQLIILVGAINIWNRIAISTHMFHKH